MVNKTDVVALALLDSDERVLICKRPQKKPMGGYWEFPGGKIENDETPESAIIREVKEELSIDINKSCIAPLTFSTYRDYSVNLLILLYVCRVWDGVINFREADEIKWVKSKELRGYKMPEGNSGLVAMIIDYL